MVLVDAMQSLNSHTSTMALTLLLIAPLILVFQGMEELHKTSIGYHGNLKSTNVLVDSYWICKVADYGLQTFRESNLHRNETIQTLSGYWLSSFYFSGSCIFFVRLFIKECLTLMTVNTNLNFFLI